MEYPRILDIFSLEYPKYPDVYTPQISTSHTLITKTYNAATRESGMHSKNRDTHLIGCITLLAISKYHFLSIVGMQKNE